MEFWAKVRGRGRKMVADMADPPLASTVKAAAG